MQTRNNLAARLSTSPQARQCPQRSRDRACRSEDGRALCWRPSCLRPRRISPGGVARSGRARLARARSRGDAGRPAGASARADAQRYPCRPNRAQPDETGSTPMKAVENEPAPGVPSGGRPQSRDRDPGWTIDGSLSARSPSTSGSARTLSTHGSIRRDCQDIASEPLEVQALRGRRLGPPGKGRGRAARRRVR